MRANILTIQSRYFDFVLNVQFYTFVVVIVAFLLFVIAFATYWDLEISRLGIKNKNGVEIV